MDMTYPKTFHTDAGTLRLVPAPEERLAAIGRYWPMGMFRHDSRPGVNMLVFQTGDVEVCDVKLQPVDIAKEDAETMYLMHRALIAAALPRYLAKGRRGVLLPCAYIKEKPRGLFESGIAIFVGPDAGQAAPAREEAAPAAEAPRGLLARALSWLPGRGGPEPDERTLWDGRLGAGATPMIRDFLGALAAGYNDDGVPMATMIGVDVRPRLALGGIALVCMVEGDGAVVVKQNPQAEDPVWMMLVERLSMAGFSELEHAPIDPTAIAEPLSPDHALH